MKKRLKEMEEEAAALRDMQAKVEKEMGGSQGLIFLIYSRMLTSHSSKPDFESEIDFSLCFYITETCLS